MYQREAALGGGLSSGFCRQGSSIVLGVVFSILFSIYRARTKGAYDEPTANRSRVLVEVDEGTSPSWMGLPLVYRDDKEKYSSVHCVGENFDSQSWVYRSCQFRHFCFDVKQKDFVVIRSAREKRFQELVDKHPHVTVSSLLSTDRSSFSLGALAGTQHYSSNLQWFPRVVDHDNVTSGYYELEGDYVLLPFRFSGPEMTIWRDWLPMFTLLSIFGLDNGKRLLPVLGDCVHSETAANQDYFHQFAWNKSILSAMGVDFESIPFLGSSKTDFRGNNLKSSNLICAKHGAAGLGKIFDYEEWSKDSRITHTVGQGPTVRAFRNFLAHNLGIALDSQGVVTAPMVVSFDVSSSKVMLDALFASVSDKIDESFASMQSSRLSDLEFSKQVTYVSASSILVTSCESDPLPAMFLPDGACLLLLCEGGVIKGSSSSFAIGWNLLATTGHMRVFLLEKQVTWNELLARIRNELHFTSMQV